MPHTQGAIDQEEQAACVMRQRADSRWPPCTLTAAELSGAVRITMRGNLIMIIRSPGQEDGVEDPPLATHACVILVEEPIEGVCDEEDEGKHDETGEGGQLGHGHRLGLD